MFCSMNCKTFYKILTDFCRTVEDFNSTLFLKSAKQTKNSSAEYQTKEIIHSIDCRTLTFLFWKSTKEIIENSSAGY